MKCGELIAQFFFAILWYWKTMVVLLCGYQSDSVVVWVLEYGGVVVWAPQALAGEIHQIGAATAQCTPWHTTKHDFHWLLFERTCTTRNTLHFKRQISGSNYQSAAATLSSTYCNVPISSGTGPITKQKKLHFKMQSKKQKNKKLHFKMQSGCSAS